MDGAESGGFRLPEETFFTVLAHTPLVSMDLIVRDAEGRILVGLRCNRPAQGSWFVPGGRIGKGERLRDAFRRITEAELGRSFDLEGARFLGVFEHLYEDNALDRPGVGTHYVVLGYELKAEPPLVPPPDQHGAFRWMTSEALLADPAVHPNTKAYAEEPGRS